MRVEEVIGGNMRTQREELGRTQELLGRDLGHWLGKAWSRQAVSTAEQGGRAFNGAELFAIANCLEMTFVRLLTPPVDVTEIEMPSGQTLPASTFVGFFGTGFTDASRDDVHNLWSELRALMDMLKKSQQSAHVAAGTAEKIVDIIDDRLRTWGSNTDGEGAEVAGHPPIFVPPAGRGRSVSTKTHAAAGGGSAVPGMTPTVPPLGEFIEVSTTSTHVSAGRSQQERADRDGGSDQEG